MNYKKITCRENRQVNTQSNDTDSTKLQFTPKALLHFCNCSFHLGCMILIGCNQKVVSHSSFRESNCTNFLSLERITSFKARQYFRKIFSFRFSLSMAVQNYAFPTSKIILQFFFKYVFHALGRFLADAFYKQSIVWIKKNHITLSQKWKRHNSQPSFHPKAQHFGSWQ